MNKSKQEIKIGDTVYVLNFEGNHSVYKIFKKRVTWVSHGEYIRCGKTFHYPSEYHLNKESAAKIGLLLTSDRLQNIVDEIARLQAEEKMVTQSLKSFQDCLDSCKT